MHRVFPSSYSLIASSQLFQFHKTNTRDSRVVVTPFMQDGNYPPRNFATFGPSGLWPPFTGIYKNCVNNFNFILQHWAGVRFYLSFLNLTKSYVFNKQSLLSFIWIYNIYKTYYPEVIKSFCRVPLVFFIFLLSYSQLKYLC